MARSGSDHQPFVAAGIPVGPYAVGYPQTNSSDPNDAANEANYLISLTKSYYQGTGLMLRPVLDIELPAPGTLSKTFTSQWVVNWANTIKAGTVVQIRYQGIVTADNGATTLTVRLRVGTTTLTGTAIISHAATDTSANHIFTGFCELVGRAAPGAAAACVAKTHYNDPGAAGAAVKAGFMGSTNFATNGALLVEVTGAWSAADANSCRLDILDVLVW